MKSDEEGNPAISELQEDVVDLFGRYVSLTKSYIERAEEKESIGSDDINVINDCFRALAHIAATLLKLHACSK